MRGYTTYGDVRGQSGTLHRTREAAERALARDQQGCESQGGYSDREVCVVGDDGILYRDESCTDPVWPSHGRSCGAVQFA